MGKKLDPIENAGFQQTLVVRQYSVRRKRLDFHHHGVQESRLMPTLVLFLFRFARLLFSGHATIAVENAALRLLAAFPAKTETTRLDFLRRTLLGHARAVVDWLLYVPDLRSVS